MKNKYYEYKNAISIQDQLKSLYGCRCLLTGVKTFQLTKHHIIKKEHGGSNSLENLALISLEIHKWLHSLEQDDLELYDLVNECLELYKIAIDNNLIFLTDLYEEEVMPLILEKIYNNNNAINF